MHHVSHIIRRTSLILIAAAMAAVSLSAWWGLHRSVSAEPDQAFARAVRWQPWGGPAWVPAISRTLSETHDPERRAAMLARLARRYPLASTLWLEWARVSHSRGGAADSVIPALDLAVAVDPGDAEMQWRAAMIVLEAGALGDAGRFLNGFIGLRPREVDRAVLVARRWLREPAGLLETVVGDNPEALQQLLVHAANWQDWPLADAVWRRLPATVRSSAEAMGHYADRLLLAGEGLRAARVWRQVEPGFAVEQVSNGGFADTLRRRSLFDWRYGDAEGVTISRDREDYGAVPPALRVHFDGSENVRLSGPEQYIVVRPGQTYEFTGRWKAVRLTTRALPHWVVIGHGAKQRTGLARVEAAGRGDWFWQAFSTRFTVPGDMEVVRLQLRRLPTQNFDRFIAGDLWLDDIAIRRVDEEEVVSAGSLHD